MLLLLLALTLLLLLLLLLLTLLLLPQRAGLAVAAVHSSRIVVRIVTTAHVCASRFQVARNRARYTACRCRMPRIACPPPTSIVATLRPLRSFRAALATIASSRHQVVVASRNFSYIARRRLSDHPM